MKTTVMKKTNPRIEKRPMESMLPKKKNGNINTNPPSEMELDNARTMIPSDNIMKPNIITNSGLFKKDTTEVILKM